MVSIGAVVILTLFIGFFVVQYLGYWTHRLLHRPELACPARAHAQHHEIHYTPDDYLSDIYREPPLKDRPIWYYLPGALVFTGLSLWLLPLYLAIPLIAELAFLGWLNDYLHGAFHLRNHWLERFKWFWRLRKLHWQHHREENTDYGIFSWFPDKLHKTFKEVITRPTYLQPQGTADGPTGQDKRSK